MVDGVLACLKAERVPVVGFLTRELRDGDRRVGFAVEALGGPTAVLAHIERSTGPQVGRYRVDVAAFERVVLPALDRAQQRLVVV